MKISNMERQDLELAACAVILAELISIKKHLKQTDKVSFSDVRAAIIEIKMHINQIISNFE